MPDEPKKPQTQQAEPAKAEPAKAEPKAESGEGASPSLLTSAKARQQQTTKGEAKESQPQQQQAQAARPVVRLPNTDDLKTAHADRFGDKPGTVRIHADPEGVRDRKVELVFFDDEGKEVGREPFKPKDDE